MWSYSTTVASSMIVCIGCTANKSSSDFVHSHKGVNKCHGVSGICYCHYRHLFASSLFSSSSFLLSLSELADVTFFSATSVVEDCPTLSPTVLFIPLIPQFLIDSLMPLPPTTFPTTSILVFATLPIICLLIRFACGATRGTIKRLNSPPMVCVSPCPR